ncbi:hypothetical protein J2R62_18020, partial [Plesiomonas shigelloides]
FALAKVLEDTSLAGVNVYIHPVMVAALALVARIIQISVLPRNLSEVLLVAPRRPLSANLDETLSRIANRHGFLEYSRHLPNIGRRYEVEVTIFVPRHGDWGIHRQAHIRQALWDELGYALGNDPSLSLCLTSESRLFSPPTY